MQLQDNPQNYCTITYNPSLLLNDQCKQLHCNMNPKMKFKLLYSN